MSGSGEVQTAGARGPRAADAQVHLVEDFVVSSRLLGVRDVESALERLLPEGEVPRDSVPVMVAVGALLTGVMGIQRGIPGGEVGAELLVGPAPVASLAGLFLSSGARGDAAGIRGLIAARCQAGGGGVLLDVLVKLMVVFAELDRSRS